LEIPEQIRKRYVAHVALIVEAVNLKKTYVLGKIPVEALRGVKL
jgi:hypothetical protein